MINETSERTPSYLRSAVRSYIRLLPASTLNASHVRLNGKRRCGGPGNHFAARLRVANLLANL